MTTSTPTTKILAIGTINPGVTGPPHELRTDPYWPAQSASSVAGHESKPLAWQPGGDEGGCSVAVVISNRNDRFPLSFDRQRIMDSVNLGDRIATCRNLRGHHVAPTASAIHKGDRRTKGPHGGGCLELSRPRTCCARLYRGQPLAQPVRIFPGPACDRGVPQAQMGQGTRLSPDQGSLGI